MRLAIPLSIVVPALTPLATAQPATVRPESLDQGFTIEVTDESAQANKDNPIFLVSNHNSWIPGTQSMRLHQGPTGLWTIDLPKPISHDPMLFKFTLGDWSRVECAIDDEDIENRTLPAIPSKDVHGTDRPIIRLTVSKFRTPNALQANASKITGDIHRLRVRVDNDTTRQIIVWLPPGYRDNPDHRYPALYLQDGQNIFERAPASAGEWHADEIATELIENAEIEPCIIIGIAHAQEHRIEEYSPFASPSVPDAAGEAYVTWLTDVLIPRVERRFRIDPNRRTLGGASLGATISIFAHAQHPTMFSGLLIESIPSISGTEKQWNRLLASIDPWPQRVYLGVGDRESAGEPDSRANQEHLQDTLALDELLKAQGLADERRLLVVSEGDTHNEDAWAKRLPAALRFLFPPIPQTPPATINPQ